VWVEIAEQSHLVFEPISHSFTTFTEYTCPLDVWFLLGDAVRTDTFSFWPFLVESGNVHGMFSVGSEEVPVGWGKRGLVSDVRVRCVCACVCVCVCVCANATLQFNSPQSRILPGSDLDVRKRLLSGIRRRRVALTLLGS
jgi:hypothetical protein